MVPARDPRARRALVLLALAATAPACFLGYDSSWGQTRASQQHAASRSQPATIAGSTEPTRTEGAAAHTWRVRFRPDALYLAQTVDAPRQVADVIEDANGVLAAAGLRLEVERIEPWSSSSDEKLAMAMTGLQQDDPGAQADLVVGMIGGLSGRTDSLHEAGMAILLGRHAVVRAATRLGEHDAIDQAFSELSEDERARIGKLRKRHRALAVLLHEVGHCLGALHESDRRSLMNPTYDPKMSGFGPGAIALMRAVLASTDRVAVAKGQLAILEGARFDGEWIPEDRDEQVARLRAVVEGARPVALASAAPDPPAAGGDAPPELRDDARATFLRAREAFRAGAVRIAYETARPLFAAYPDVYAVQDLRCQLAAVRLLPREQMRSECATVTRLLSACASGDAGACK